MVSEGARPWGRGRSGDCEPPRELDDRQILGIANGGGGSGKGVSKGGFFARGVNLNNWGGARTGCNN